MRQSKGPQTVREIYQGSECIFFNPYHPRATTSDNLDGLAKTAPHLFAILSRTANRTRKALPFRFNQPAKRSSPSTPSTSDYRPSSISSFLARLSTYKLTTYGNKPPAIDAVAAAKCGWANDGKDRLACGLCGVSWVVAGKDGMTRDGGMLGYLKEVGRH